MNTLDMPPEGGSTCGELDQIEIDPFDHRPPLV